MGIPVTYSINVIVYYTDNFYTTYQLHLPHNKYLWNCYKCIVKGQIKLVPF